MAHTDEIVVVTGTAAVLDVGGEAGRRLLAEGDVLLGGVGPPVAPVGRALGPVRRPVDPTDPVGPVGPLCPFGGAVPPVRPLGHPVSAVLRTGSTRQHLVRGGGIDVVHRCARHGSTVPGPLATDILRT